VIHRCNLFRDRARIFLIRDHEDQNFCMLVRTRIPGHGVNRGRRLVKCFPSLEGAAGLAVDSNLVGPLDDVSERVMSGVAVPGAAASGLPIQQADADLASRQISERLGEEGTGSSGSGLRRRRCDKPRRAPRPNRRNEGGSNGNPGVG
jgi:hypothetical protein